MSASPGEERPFINHLLELRGRLLKCAAVVVVLFLCLFPFAGPLYGIVAEPALAALPQGSTLIATSPVGPFLVPMKLSLLLALMLSVPFLLYQVWAFIAPGLYRHEQRLVWPLLVSTTALFYLGGAFAYFVVLPRAFAFLFGFSPEVSQVMPDIGQVLDFITAMFLVFGASFEIPVATVLVVHTGMASREDLIVARPYVIVGAFVVGAIFTPPDILSQFMLAVPMWLLYELGILCSAWFERSRPQEEAEPPAER